MIFWSLFRAELLSWESRSCEAKGNAANIENPLSFYTKGLAHPHLPWDLFSCSRGSSTTPGCWIVPVGCSYAHEVICVGKQNNTKKNLTVLLWGEGGQAGWRVALPLGVWQSTLTSHRWWRVGKIEPKLQLALMKMLSVPLWRRMHAHGRATAMLTSLAGNQTGCRHISCPCPSSSIEAWFAEGYVADAVSRLCQCLRFWLVVGACSCCREEAGCPVVPLTS